MTNERTSRRTGLAVGLSAGLIGGTAAGMIFGVPGSTSASAGDTTVAVAVAQVEEDVDIDTTDDVTPLRGERLRERLDTLVTDGTITAEQADAVAGHLAKEGAEWAEDRGRIGRPDVRDRRLGERFDVVSDLLGVDGETMRNQLREGSTLAEIAASNGVSTDQLVDALVAEAMERIDAAVAAGRIEQATADERTADLEDRVTERVTTPRGER